MARRLVLLDGHAIIHRAYHALPPLTSSSGQLINAVYGFVSMLLRVIEELKPDFLAVCFDLPIPTFRHEAYIAYQAKRPVMDEELSGQIELVHEVVEAAGIPIYTSPGFEADDVIGTLAKQAVAGKWEVRGEKLDNEVGSEKSHISLQSPTLGGATPASYIARRTSNSEIEIIIVTGDRDILQLVSKKVKVYMTIRGLADAKMFNEKDVEEYIGIKPSQIVDYKALIGDSSDNYPGVPGVGPKTAVGLLKEYGNLEKIYEAVRRWEVRNEKLGNDVGSAKSHISHQSEAIPASHVTLLTSSLITKLKEGKEAAMLSQRLAQIRTDAPVELDLGKAEIGDLAKNDKFIDKLRELRFKSLVGRLVGVLARKANIKQQNGQMGLI